MTKLQELQKHLPIIRGCLVVMEEIVRNSHNQPVKTDPQPYKDALKFINKLIKENK